MDKAVELAKEIKEKELKKIKEEQEPILKKIVAGSQQADKKAKGLDKDNPDNAKLKEEQEELKAVLKEIESKHESLKKELEHKEKVILELNKWLGLRYLEGANKQKDWEKEVTILALAVQGKLSPEDKKVIKQLNKELLVDGIQARFGEIEKIYYYIRGLIKTGEQANLEIEKKGLETEQTRLKQGDTQNKEKNTRAFRTLVDVSLEIEEINLKSELAGKEAELAKMLRTANSKPALEQVVVRARRSRG